MLKLPFEIKPCSGDCGKECGAALEKCPIFPDLPADFQAACRESPHLLQYLRMLPPDKIALPQYFEKVTRAQKGNKNPNISAKLPAANRLQTVIENSGQTRLASFDKWDFIVQYYDAADNYYVNWLPCHQGALGNNQWQETGIYFNGQPEAFEPGILNPQEQLNLEAILNPAAGYRAIDITLATPNGIAPTLVCGPPVLTAHSETVSPGGTDFYMLKGWTPANGAAVTATTARISVNETGRWLLHNSADGSRNAACLFPLSGINKIAEATWTVHYHGKADGWASESFANASLSIDIIIREADGSVRTAVATDVAQATFTGSDDWVDISASYSFPGYTVVKDTDYLEIDFYGNSDSSGPDGAGYLRLMVDNNTLPVSSQTRIEGLAWS